MKAGLMRRFVVAASSLLLLAALATAGAAPPAASPVPIAGGAPATVAGWFGARSSEPQLLPADEAFRLEVRAKDASTLVATLTPAADYYLYRDRIKFSIEPPLSIAGVSLPPGDFKDDPTFGRTEVYHRPAEAVIRLSAASAAPVVLHASYQGCNEPVGVCYPPIEKTLTVAMSPGVAAAPAADVAARSAADDASESGRARLLFAHGAWAVMAAFFGFGVLLAFTPCMLPMLPILSGIIVGQGPQRSRWQALRLSALYVLGMAITYAAAGVAAGLAGTLLSPYLQNAWVLGAFAAIFVLLALSMFGLYELQLPSSLQTAMANAGRRIPGGRAAGVFLMGALSALIVGPCVAAPLAGALLYIGQTHDALLGGAALFALALGMGVPLLAVGTSAGDLMRRAGPWTESIKRAFGVALLATAIYLLSPVMPLAAQQLMWAALLIVCAMFVRAIDPLPPDAPAHRRFFKGLGVIGLVTGVALLIGALSRSPELLQPLAGVRGSPAQESPGELPFRRVASVADLDAQLRAARGRGAMLDFWAEWCVSCKEMERSTFADTRVRARLKDMLLLRADVTANSADDQTLLRRFHLFGPPGIVFFDGQGREIAYRVTGYEPPEKFLASLARALAPDEAFHPPTKESP
jgi:thioredoxin:protein disulfide reductase